MLMQRAFTLVLYACLALRGKHFRVLSTGVAVAKLSTTLADTAATQRKQEQEREREPGRAGIHVK
jgi:hypothetical protein